MGNASSSLLAFGDRGGRGNLIDHLPTVAASAVIAVGIYYFVFVARRGGRPVGTCGSGSGLLSRKVPPYALSTHTSPNPLDTVEAVMAATGCTDADAVRGVLQDVYKMWTVDRLVSFHDSPKSDAATTSDDNHCPHNHESFLTTLYDVTTFPTTSGAATRLPYARRGADLWGSLGFQGDDPATDLRGGGILSLEQFAVFCATSALLKSECDLNVTCDANYVMLRAGEVQDVLNAPFGHNGQSLVQLLDVVIADTLPKVPKLETRVSSNHPKPIPAATTASAIARGGLHDSIVEFNHREHSGGGSAWYLEACVSIQFTLQLLQDLVRKLHSSIVNEGIAEPPASKVTNADEAPKKRKTLLKKVETTAASSATSSPCASSLKIPNTAGPADVVLTNEMLRFLVDKSISHDEFAVRLATLHYLLIATMHSLWVRQRPHVMEYQTFMQRTFVSIGSDVVSRTLWLWRTQNTQE